MSKVIYGNTVGGNVRSPRRAIAIEGVEIVGSADDCVINLVGGSNVDITTNVDGDIIISSTGGLGGIDWENHDGRLISSTDNGDVVHTASVGADSIILSTTDSMMNDGIMGYRPDQSVELTSSGLLIQDRDDGDGVIDRLNISLNEIVRTHHTYLNESDEDYSNTFILPQRSGTLALVEDFVDMSDQLLGKLDASSDNYGAKWGEEGLYIYEETQESSDVGMCFMPIDNNQSRIRVGGVLDDSTNYTEYILRNFGEQSMRTIATLDDCITNTLAGVVASNATENGVMAIAEVDGTYKGKTEVHSLNTKRLVQTKGDYFVLNGGNAFGILDSEE